ncbi:cation diffusion facilitator family transporter [Derxia gummosa]|uniref:Cation diffusion facilitator family transporter n=1 Tax=Derxia gummosa DSM 723 TaxID=1121388 RepID=A0A8B6XBQ2_9BURK|nr:cation diffusion facilitator family transporter [Derxia gummosa]
MTGQHPPAGREHGHEHFHGAPCAHHDHAAAADAATAAHHAHDGCDHDSDHGHDHGHDHAGHAHAHGHHHGHGHHHHGPLPVGKAFAVGIALNLGFVLVEAGFGFASDSLALLADAGHNLSDVAALALAWAASWLSGRAPTPSRTWGYGRSSILASLVNAIALLVAVGAIAWESVGRLADPQPVAEMTVAVVAAIGIVINSATAWFFMHGKDSDINLRGAYLHMVADAAVSLGVVLAALAMRATGWLWLDPALSLVICAVLVWGTWGLLRESVDMALDAVPASIDRAAVERWLAARPGVTEVHDLHIWPISASDIALTAHLVKPDGGCDDGELHAIADGLKARFGIGHVTVQVERGDHERACRYAPAEVI